MYSWCSGFRSDLATFFWGPYFLNKQTDSTQKEKYKIGKQKPTTKEKDK